VDKSINKPFRRPRIFPAGLLANSDRGQSILLVVVFALLWALLSTGSVNADLSECKNPEGTFQLTRSFAGTNCRVVFWENQSRGFVMPNDQIAFLNHFKRACDSYNKQPNEIKKSAVFRESQKIWSRVKDVKDWAGYLIRIQTNQAGSRAWLIIKVLDFKFHSESVALGSPVYRGAADMLEGQEVVFAGRGLQDYTLTEKGKVCEPDFKVELTDLPSVKP